MSETRYTKEHEYIRLDGETGTVGITHYAQNALGDVVYVELPENGRITKKGEEIAVVESVKAASEIYAPVSGEITSINSALEGAPSTVNEDSAGQGWFVKIKLSDVSEFQTLMTAQAYEDYLKTIS
jgi:glycine cleavage system H protein